MAQDKSLIANLIHYAKRERRYFLIPLLLFLLLLGILIILAKTAPVVSPFLYVFF